MFRTPRRAAAHGWLTVVCLACLSCSPGSAPRGTKDASAYDGASPFDASSGDTATGNDAQPGQDATLDSTSPDSPTGDAPPGPDGGDAGAVTDGSTDASETGTPSDAGDASSDATDASPDAGDASPEGSVSDADVADGGGNTVSGSVDGVTLTINHATGFYTASVANGASAGFIFSNNTDDCSRKQAGLSGWAPGETVLVVGVFESGASPVAPGTYTIGGGDAAAPQVQGAFMQFDAQCTVTPPKPNGDVAVSGSITITSASSSAIAGTFSLTFPPQGDADPGGTLTGTFDVPVCNLAPGQGPGGNCTTDAGNCCG